MPGEAIAALSVFKGLYDSAKALKDMNDAAVRNSAVIELQEKILSAQAAQSDLVERIRGLEEEVREFKTWEIQKQRYELKSIGHGSLAFVLKPEMRGTEPPHLACTNCFSNGRISFIQYMFVEKVGYRYQCPSCKILAEPSGNVIDGSGFKWPE